MSNADKKVKDFKLRPVSVAQSGAGLKDVYSDLKNPVTIVKEGTKLMGAVTLSDFLRTQYQIQ
jgi:hypothetical protein